MGPYLEATVEMLKRNGWFTPNPGWDASIVLLFKEYVRRLHRWELALGITDGSLWRSDLAAVIDPKIRLSDEDRSIWLSQCRTFGQPWGPITGVLCGYSLQWANLKDHRDGLKEYALLDPYEPLLWMFQRGGKLNIDKSYVEIMGDTLWIAVSSSWISQLEERFSETPLVELDQVVLDAIDAEANNK